MSHIVRLDALEILDTMIADFAVAAAVHQIKAGSVWRGKRISKYNRLLEVEHELRSKARYAGKDVYAQWRQRQNH